MRRNKNRSGRPTAAGDLPTAGANKARPVWCPEFDATPAPEERRERGFSEGARREPINTGAPPSSADATIGRNPPANWPRSPGGSWPLAKPLALRQPRPDPPVAASLQGIGRQKTKAESKKSSRLGDSDNERWAPLPDRQENSAYRCPAVRNHSLPRDDSGKQKVVSSSQIFGVRYSSQEQSCFNGSCIPVMARR